MWNFFNCWYPWIMDISSKRGDNPTYSDSSCCHVKLHSLSSWGIRFYFVANCARGKTSPSHNDIVLSFVRTFVRWDLDIFTRPTNDQAFNICKDMMNNFIKCRAAIHPSLSQEEVPLLWQQTNIQIQQSNRFAHRCLFQLRHWQVIPSHVS